MNYKNFYAALTLGSSVLVAAAPTQTEAASIFKDIEAGSEMNDAILQLAERNIINGYSDGTFRPQASVTRAQAAKIIAGALELQTENSAALTFNDIGTSHYAYNSVAALVELGVFDGSSASFRPEDPITRAEIAKILVTAFKLENLWSYLPFDDTDQHWAHSYIQTLYSHDITKGVSSTLFGVNSTVTRGQLATFITRTEKVAPKIYKNSPTYTIKATDGNNIIYWDMSSRLEKKIFTVLDAYESDDNKTVTIKALEPGVDYFQIIVDPEDPEDYAGYHHEYYKVTITEENRTLKMDVQKLDYIVQFNVLDSKIDLSSYSISSLDGTPVAPEHLADAFYRDSTTSHITFKNLVGEFLVDATYFDGTKETFGVSLSEPADFGLNPVYIGHYAEGIRDIRLPIRTPWLHVDLEDIQYYSLQEIDEDNGNRFKKIENDEIKVDVLSDRLQITPNKPGKYELTLKDSLGRNETFRIRVVEFHNGYITQVDY